MYKSKPTFFTDYKKIRQRVNDVGLFVAKITNVKGSGAEPALPIRAVVRLRSLLTQTINALTRHKLTVIEIDG